MELGRNRDMMENAHIAVGTRCGGKYFFFSNINVIPFKIVSLGRYTPTEISFLPLVAALEDFNRYSLQYVHYTFWMISKVPKVRLDEMFKFRRKEKVTGAEVR